MIFSETRLKGLVVVEPERHTDERGFFARTWCMREFFAAGLNSRLSQCSVSFNPRRGTLRGMHFQRAPYEEAKLVRCTSGAIYDVAIDLRRNSPTFCKWVGIELTARSHRMIYVPEGFAHGFQTLEDDTEIFYQISEFHEPGATGGVRWDDPAFGIEWPFAERIISARDAAYADFDRSDAAGIGSSD